MRKEIKTVVYDDELRLEAYRFEGVVQPFPNHFHEYYVIGFVEGGERCLSCRNQEYTIGKGNVILFNPGDSHACIQTDDGTLDYRGFNITKPLGKENVWVGGTGAYPLHVRNHHSHVPCDKTDDSSADRWGIAAVCICRNVRIDAGVWKAAITVYR